MLQHIRVDGKFRKVYKGFRRLTQAHIWAPSEILVIVWFEGDPETYISDGTSEAISQLRLLYKDDYGVEGLTIRAYDPLSPLEG